MKYIKKFEKNRSLKVGDYVLIKLKDTNIFSDDIKRAKYFVNTHIGKCSYIKTYEYDKLSNSITVKYENIPNDIQSYFHMDFKKNVGYREFDISRVLAYSKTIDEIEMILNAKKYNL